MKIIRFMLQSFKKIIKKILTINIDTRSIFQLPNSVLEKQFTGKVAIVTGGGGGIGAAICKRIAIEGARVYICGRTEASLQKVSSEIKELGGIGIPLVLDITDYESTKQKICEVFEKEKHIDFLVNCAGGSAREKSKQLIDQDISVIMDVIQTNLFGTINMCKIIAPFMVKNNFGSIVNISSIIAIGGKSLCCDYSAAKAGINGFSKSLAIELGVKGVRVNVVSPGKILRGVMSQSQVDINVSCNYLGTPGRPEDIANAVSFFLSDQAKFITGVNLCVDGGRTLGLHGD